MSNTGQNGCQPSIDVVRKVILVPTFDSTGERNSIDLTDTLDADFFSDLINEADSSKRWYPLPNIVDVDDKRGDAIMQELSNRSKIFVADGTRAFSGMIWGKDGGPILKGILDVVRCGEVSAWLVDKKGNLIVGEVSDDGETAYPFLLDTESVVGTPIYATDTTVQGIKLSFNFSQDQDDACIRIVKTTDLGDANLLTLKGLQDVYAKYATPTVTGVVITLYTKGIDPLNPVTVKGLVAGDFAFTNVTDSGSSIGIAGSGGSLTEADGVYTVTYDTADQPTVSDVIKVVITKDGFDFTAVAADTYVTA